MSQLVRTACHGDSCNIRSTEEIFEAEGENGEEENFDLQQYVYMVLAIFIHVATYIFYYVVSSKL